MPIPNSRTLLTMICLISGPATLHAQNLAFHATMSPANEVVPSHSTGTGECDLTLDATSHLLHYTLIWSGLTGPATMAHFHGPAKAGVAAPVALPLKGVMTSPLIGSATLTAQQQADLTAGLWYCNVHTEANPKGELRGQLAP